MGEKVGQGRGRWRQQLPRLAADHLDSVAPGEVLGRWFGGWRCRHRADDRGPTGPCRADVDRSVDVHRLRLGLVLRRGRRHVRLRAGLAPDPPQPGALLHRADRRSQGASELHRPHPRVRRRHGGDDGDDQQARKAPRTARGLQRRQTGVEMLHGADGGMPVLLAWAIAVRLLQEGPHDRRLLKDPAVAEGRGQRGRRGGVGRGVGDTGAGGRCRGDSASCRQRRQTRRRRRRRRT
mmetsp:Transcript_27464/g.79591  ORF Transcript_27464/g.79591 Transcript_27464/m.79591 type:complete len:236 (+) Transcript_27464:328-1035(+)